jgi:hypothetical protein
LRLPHTSERYQVALAVVRCDLRTNDLEYMPVFGWEANPSDDK